jgi:large subunit ribosomal protein L31e
MSDQETELERVYTVPLSRAWITARHQRTKRAVHILREFAEHHMKSSEIKIDTELNEALWKKGITKPPRRITVKMEKDEDGVVTISLPKEAKKRPEEVTPPMSSKEEPAQLASAPSEPAPSKQAEAASADTSAAKSKKQEAPRPKKQAAKATAKKKTSENSA